MAARLLTVLALNACHIGYLLAVEESCYSGKKALSKGSVTGDDVRKPALLDVFDQQRCPVLRQALDTLSAQAKFPLIPMSILCHMHHSQHILSSQCP